MASDRFNLRKVSFFIQSDLCKNTTEDITDLNDLNIFYDGVPALFSHVDRLTLSVDYYYSTAPVILAQCGLLLL